MGLAGLNLWTTVAAQSTALLLLPDAPLGAICAAAVLASVRSFSNPEACGLNLIHANMDSRTNVRL